MNVYDSQKIADVLIPMGYEQVDTPDDADMLVLNTCHIREKATEKVFSDLGRMRPHKTRREEQGKKTVIAVAGCVAQAEGDVILDRAPYVDLVFGPQVYHQLPQMVAKVTGEDKNRVVNTDFPVESKFDYLPEEHESPGPSAFVAVQEGCDKFCTFCVVPYTRGSEFSRPVQSILDEAKRLVETGSQEIFLLGQNVNGYHGTGPNGKEWTLADVIKSLADIDGLSRIRYTTSHPCDMQDDLINAHGEIDKLMPYLHLPIQSGSNKILKAMNRKHTHEEYREIIAKLRAVRPDISLSSDIIVGFPGETDEDFEDTMSIVRDVVYGSCYSFKYSARPGTPAAIMKNQVLEKDKDSRLARLQSLITDQQSTYNKSFIGQTLPVLFDRKGRDEGQLIGRSPYMQSVHVKGNERLFGQMVNVKIKRATASSLSGEIDIID